MNLQLATENQNLLLKNRYLLVVFVYEFEIFEQKLESNITALTNVLHQGEDAREDAREDAGS